ncbi:MAG: hypothetical protein JJU35_08335 [Balneolales bacterium]|nr:hypothetical protein [Balneolales bacterium]
MQKAVMAASEADRLGFPLITNYGTDVYGQHIQNWGFESDTDGNLLVANQGGLMIYDGERWLHFLIPNASTFSVKHASDGNIYLGGNNEIGVVRPVDVMAPPSTGLRTYESLSGLISPDKRIGTVWAVEEHEGRIFFMAERYLIVLEEGEIELFPAPAFFVRMALTREGIIVYDREHKFMQFRDGGLHSWNPAGIEQMRGFRGYTALEELDLFCDPGSCYVYDGFEMRSWQTSPSDILSDVQISNLITLGDGSVMLATRRSGLIHLSAQAELLRIINTETGLIHNTVYGLHEDTWGSIWAATLNGISRVDASLPLRIFDKRSGLESLVQRMLMFEGEFYVFTQSGIKKMTPSGIFTEVSRQPDCNRYTKHQGVLYLRCQGDLFMLRNGELNRFPSFTAVNSVSEWDEHRLLMATDAGLVLVKTENGVLQPETTRSVFTDEELSGSINNMIRDPRGWLWVGSENAGLYQFETGEANGEPSLTLVQRHFTEARNLRRLVRVLPKVLQGEPSFLTWGYGVMRFNAETGEMESVPEWGEFFSSEEHQFFWASEDPWRNIWWRAAGGYRGLLQTGSGQLTEYTGVLNLVPGFQSNYLTTDPNGQLWISTEEGLIRYVPQHNFDASRPFNVQLYRLFRDGVQQFRGELQEMRPVFPFSKSLMRFLWSSNTFMGSNQYRVKLAGFDADWTPWSAETQRDFTSLPEGRYEFVIQARNAFGGISTSEPFIFTVLPPWHRSWWAYLLYLGAIGSLFYIGFTIRLKKLTREYQMRNRISADLHDEVSATLSSISFFAQAIASGRKPDQNEKFLSLILESSGDAKEKISDIVWAINPENDEWNSFFSRCRRFASDVFESRNIAFTLRIDESYPGKIDMQLRQHLWMIFKEMITNVARHSGASRAEVILHIKNGELQLVVQDDGRGLSNPDASSGNGLRNIRQRADKIRATAVLETEPGRGTRWIVRVML